MSFTDLGAYEKDVPTENQKTSSPPRLSQADEHYGRPQCDQAPPFEGQKDALRLKTVCMLPRKNRLKSHTEIDEVFQKGELWRSPSFSVKFLRRESEVPLMRVAFSFGKKHLRRALDRNRLKRRLTALLTEPAENARQSVDLVFFLQKPGNLPEKEDLQRELENFLSKLYNSFK